MSPWRMMNEWGIPTVYLECLLYRYLSKLEQKGAFIPSCAIAGGIALEDQVFKAIALAAPYIKAVCIGRATLSAAMVGKTNGEKLRKEYGEGYGEGDEYHQALLRTFINAGKLREKYGKDFYKIPPAAIGMCNYYDRLTAGLQQFMAGARKFHLNLLERGDLMALTREAAEFSGIPYVMDADEEEAERILG